jgi:hypothetical protein
MSEGKIIIKAPLNIIFGSPNEIISLGQQKPFSGHGRKEHLFRSDYFEFKF